jgi:hypothetical protein
MEPSDPSHPGKSKSYKQRGDKPIEIDRTVVQGLGQAPLEIWWRGAQWAVTAFGIECLDGQYHIPKERLLEGIGGDHAWPEHMSEKTWNDNDEFATAWLVAIVMHGYGGQITRAQIKQAIAAMDEEDDARNME